MLNLNIQNEKIIGANNKILLFQSGFKNQLIWASQAIKKDGCPTIQADHNI